MLVLVAVACGPRVPPTQPAQNVEEYVPLPSEVPQGFALVQIDMTMDDVELMGLTGNPGYIRNRQTWGDLCNAPATGALEVYVAVYENSSAPNEELGVVAVRLDSPQRARSYALACANVRNPNGDLMHPGSRYLVEGSVMVMVWSDSDKYSAQVASITDSLDSRLDMAEI